MSKTGAPLFALVAGESSGDALGAGLIRELARRYPDARFVGVGGPAMRSAGCECWADADALALFGFSEVVSRIPSLLCLRRRLARAFEAAEPAVFVGIDAPAFNTALEKRLRRRGILTVHYVCPTVWAWRASRVRALAKADDRLLAIFPFEPAFFARCGIDARFVGHPLADRQPPHTDRDSACSALDLPMGAPVVALLPGSRLGEIRRIAPRFIAAAARLRRDNTDVQFVIPAASPAVRAALAQTVAEARRHVDIRVVDGRAREVLQAADAALVASGTATLEALLLDTPMVVGYVVSPLNAALVRLFRLLKSEFVAMPNLLAGHRIVPERLQNAATPDTLAADIHRLLTDAGARAAQKQAFADIRAELTGEADVWAADAVCELLAAKR